MKIKIKDIVKQILIKEAFSTEDMMSSVYDDLSAGVEEMQKELEKEKKELEAQRDATKRTQGINQYEDPEMNSKDKQFKRAKLSDMEQKIKDKESQQKKIEDLSNSVNDLENSKVTKDEDNLEDEQLGTLDALK